MKYVIQIDIIVPCKRILCEMWTIMINLIKLGSGGNLICEEKGVNISFYLEENSPTHKCIVIFYN